MSNDPFIEQIIKWIIPIIKWIIPKCKEPFNKFKVYIEIKRKSPKKFSEYLNRTYQAHRFINTLVFDNQPKPLDALYVPITLKSIEYINKYTNKVSQEYKIDGYPENLFSTYSKIIISDTGGMGKSTVMKKIFLSIIDGNKKVPIFIELRKLNKKNDILKEIYQELQPLDNKFSTDFILALIKRGYFIFFLDGYDEIPFEEKKFVTESLHSFISKAGNNLFLLSSRSDSAAGAFEGFQNFNIKELNTEEAFSLITKYDNDGEISKKLINQIKGEMLPKFKEFLSNPLLVSLLYKSYAHKSIIPQKKHLFYRDVYDALFESHDLKKGGAFKRNKKSQLHTDDFHKVLRGLGYRTFKQGGIEYDKDEITKILTETKQGISNITFQESDFLSDLTDTVPLFNKEGDHYKWNHKSIQEYFFAEYIYKDTDDKHKRLKCMYNNDDYKKYIDVLDLYYDIDYNSFRMSIIFDLVCRFMKYYEFVEGFNQNNCNDGVLTSSIISFPLLCLLKGDKDKVKLSLNNKVIMNCNGEYINLFLQEDIIKYCFLHECDNFLIYENPFFPILNLLFKKQEKIVEEVPIFLNEKKFREDKFINFVEKSKDNQNKPPKSSSPSVTYRFPSLTLNYIKCQKIKEEIEREKNNYLQEDFLI